MKNIWYFIWYDLWDKAGKGASRLMPSVWVGFHT